MSTFIFDIDGTLIYSVPMYLLGLQATMRRYGREFSLDALTFSNGIPSIDTAHRLGYHGDAAAAMIRQWVQDADAHQDSVGWFAGMPETLKQLRHNGAGLAIVTSKAAPEFAQDDARFGFSDYVDTAVLAHDAKRNKPFGDPIELAMQRLGVQDAIYVGDTATDAQAAHNAGVPFALATWTTQPSAALEPIAYALKRPQDLLTL